MKQQQHHLHSPQNTKTSINAFQYFDSACSTPFVSAPSSPDRSAGRAAAFFYSAPTSPMHYLFSHSHHLIQPTPQHSSSSTDLDIQDFDFYSSKKISSMSSADELFFNGKIRPVKLTHVPEEEAFYHQENGAVMVRGRRSRSLRRIRSLSPVRTDEKMENAAANGGATAARGNDTAARGNDVVAREEDARPGGGKRRWVSLKEFLYRSKSEGRNNGRHKYFSLFKEKDRKVAATTTTVVAEKGKAGAVVGGKKRVGLSAHEVHYTANRAVAEEMKRRTFLPYRQGLLGCLGFNSKGYGVISGFAKALNSVSSS